MSTETTTALAALTSRASSDETVEYLAETVRDRLAHTHPQPGGGEDLYCLNLTSFMGERMGGVLVRLREAETERDALRTERTTLIKLHEYDELIFGGFICTLCTPDDCDDPDDNVMWPCPPLRAVGMTDEEGVELILARRAAIEEKHRRELAAQASPAAPSGCACSEHGPCPAHGSVTGDMRLVDGPNGGC